MKIERKDVPVFVAAGVFIVVIIIGFTSIPEYPDNESSFVAVVGVIAIATGLSLMLGFITWALQKLLRKNNKNVA